MLKTSCSRQCAKVRNCSCVVVAGFIPKVWAAVRSCTLTAPNDVRPGVCVRSCCGPSTPARSNRMSAPRRPHGRSASDRHLLQSSTRPRALPPENLRAVQRRESDSCYANPRILPLLDIGTTTSETLRPDLPAQDVEDAPSRRSIGRLATLLCPTSSPYQRAHILWQQESFFMPIARHELGATCNFG